MPINREKRPIKFATHKTKISAGYSIPNEKSPNGKQPKSADHFIITHPENGECYFPEIADLYGNEPKELYVTFPSDNHTDFYKEDFKRWGGNNSKISVCDGETCSFYFDYQIGSQKYKAGQKIACPCKALNLFETEDKELKKKASRVDLYLTMMILNPNILLDESLEPADRIVPISPLCYIFEAHSINTADNIFSELDRYKKLANYPFVLSVKKVKGNNSSYPLTYLAPFVTPTMLISYNMKMESIALQGGTKQLENNTKDFALPEKTQTAPTPVKNSTGKEVTATTKVINETPVVTDKPKVTKEQVLEKNKEQPGTNIFELPVDLVEYYKKELTGCMTMKAYNEVTSAMDKDTRLTKDERTLLNTEASSILTLIQSAT